MSIGFASLCSIALTSRLRRIRSIRRPSTSAVHGPGAWITISVPARWANWAWSSTTCRTIADQIDRRRREHGRTGVEPGDLQQVTEQGLEPVELVLQQLGRAGGDRVELVPGLVQHLRRHPDRGQRGPQLMGDVGHERLLDVGEVLELGDLLLQLLGHVVHRRRQPGEVVLAPHLHPVVEVARRQALGRPSGRPDRSHHLAGHQRRDEGQQDDQDRPGRPGGRPQEAERVDLLVQREDEIDLVRPRAGQRQLRAADQAGDRRPHRRGRPRRSASSAGRCWPIPAGAGRRARSPHRPGRR